MKAPRLPSGEGLSLLRLQPPCRPDGVLSKIGDGIAAAASDGHGELAVPVPATGLAESVLAVAGPDAWLAVERSETFGAL